MSAPLAPSIGESDFAEWVRELADTAEGRDELVVILREEHPVYAGRGGATVSRMRGWVLLGIGQSECTPAVLAYVLEELQSGLDPYLVTVAASVLRSHPQPDPAFTPFVLQALARICWRNDPVCLAEYGGAADDALGTTPVDELFRTLDWLGSQARHSLTEIEHLISPTCGLPQPVVSRLTVRAESLRSAPDESGKLDCCRLPRALERLLCRRPSLTSKDAALPGAQLEDQSGRCVTYREYFVGRPTIVAFFYSRCDNPQKCSLTIAKLARIQELLRSAGLADQIQTAAITYDPEYDDSDRMRRYGDDRGVRCDERHRLFRTIEGYEALCRYFGLGVNYVRSLVNRHRLEVFVVDSAGRIAVTFERLLWSEEQVVAAARGCLAMTTQPVWSRRGAVLGTLASLGVAVFPKCPVCWAAYLSFFGIAGLEQLPYAPWLLPVLVGLMLLNILSVGWRARSSGRYWPLGCVVVGAVVLTSARLDWARSYGAAIGVLLTVIGSCGSAVANWRLPWMQRLTNSSDRPAARGGIPAT